MLKIKQEKKTDRRSLITQKIIKEAFLLLLNKTSYADITVTAICEKAQVSRSSFYLHYDSVHDVLESVLSDIFEQADLSHDFFCIGDDTCCKNVLSFCQYVRNNKEYHVLFTKNYLNENIRDALVKYMANLRKIDSSQQNVYLKKNMFHIFDFYFAGCLCVLKNYLTVSDETWKLVQSDMLKITQKGFLIFKET